MTKKVDVLNLFDVRLILLIGVIVVVILSLKIKKKIDFYRSDIREVDRMNGHDFERYLMHLFKRHGYKASKTKGSGDFGVDLLLEKDNCTIAVQAKRYKSKVNLKAVQEVVGGRGYYNTDEAWVVTNSFYTKSAYELAKKNGVRLIHRTELIKMMLKHR